jgi:hypothetical protein
MDVERHFNIQLNIQEVETKTPNATRAGGTLIPEGKPGKRLINPIEIRVTAPTLDRAVAKVKAYLDIEVEDAL